MKLNLSPSFAKIMSVSFNRTGQPFIIAKREKFNSNCKIASLLLVSQSLDVSITLYYFETLDPKRVLPIDSLHQPQLSYPKFQLLRALPMELTELHLSFYNTTLPYIPKHNVI